MTYPESGQAEMAVYLRYGDGPEAIAAMNREHDDFHLKLMRLLGRESLSLTHAYDRRPVHPTKHHEAIGWEERLVLGTQMWMNSGEDNPDVAYLWWCGLDPDRVRRALRP